MKWKKSIKMKNKLDEMQEQKLLRIEHNGCWLAFWGLAISLLVQQFIYGQGEWKYVAGEWIVFVCLDVYIVFSCMKNGIWDRRFEPTPTVTLIASMIAGVSVGIYSFFTSYREYHKLYGSIATGAVYFILVFVTCFLSLSLLTFLYIRKRDKIENEEDDLKDE